MSQHDVNADFGECTRSPEAYNFSGQQKLEGSYLGPLRWAAPQGDLREYQPFTLQWSPAHKFFRTVKALFPQFGGRL